MSLWLPRWSTDRLRRAAARVEPPSAEETPLVTAVTLGSRRLVAAVNKSADAAGIAPGLPLADAQAFLPGLAVREADPAGDAAALRRLAEWCGRWSPWTVPDGTDGILLDITGCAHLWGGERRLAEAIVERIARQGYVCRAAIADTTGTAWAASRFGDGARPIVPSGAERAALAPLPIAALRLSTEIVASLARLGLKRIGDLHAMPRSALALRFGKTVAQRLDQAVGTVDEPVSPLRPAPARRARLAFAEPIATAEDLARACRHLVAELCCGLAAEGMGARRLDLACYRVDGKVERAAIGTARPNREARHLARLLEEKLAAIDPGLGIEDMILAAPLAEPLAAAQLRLRNPLPFTGEGRVRAGAETSDGAAIAPMPSPRPSPALAETIGFRCRDRRSEASPRACGRGRNETADDTELASLLDRLGNRLGLANLRRLAPRESHIPERAVAILPALGMPGEERGCWPTDWIRPIRLLAPPEPIEATAPDDPPILFRWRRLLHRVRRADGPERIAGEWWRAKGSGEAGAPDDIRDYYRIEDGDGRRFWLFRAGLYRPDRPARWFLHGVFA